MRPSAPPYGDWAEPRPSAPPADEVPRGRFSQDPALPAPSDADPIPEDPAPQEVPQALVWRQRNRGRVLGARQLGGFASFLALGFASFLAPAISRETNECV